MKITIIKLILGGNFLPDDRIYEIELECEGQGTEKAPIIINSSLLLPKEFEIFESKLYIKIKNCNLEYLGLFYCKNIIIENSTFNYLGLYNSTNIIIRESNPKSTTINLSDSCSVYDSTINRLILNYSHNNIFTDCTFYYISNPENGSRGNKLKNCNIPEDFSNELIDISSPKTDFKQPFFLNARWNTYKVMHENRGTKEDPIVIDKIDTTIRDYVFYSLRNNRDHAIFRNFHPDRVLFFNDKNILLENCRFSKYFYLKYCSNLIFDNISTNTLKVGKCQDIIINNSTFERINLLKEFKGGITFRNCQIKYLEQSIFNTCKFEECIIKNIFSNRLTKYLKVEDKWILICPGILITLFFFAILSIFLFENIGRYIMIILQVIIMLILGILSILVLKRISKAKQQQKKGKKSYI